MKLIIDIPNEVYETRNFVNYFSVCSTKLLETIDTGIPYEEQKQGECTKMLKETKCCDCANANTLSCKTVGVKIINAVCPYFEHK